MSESEVLDARGQRCPMPVVLLARAAGAHAVGDTLVLLSDDPAAANDVPAWCRLRGQQLDASAPWDGDATGATTAFTVTLVAPAKPID